jgi:pimeloyl-ACP methyl ester carboxylesterase
MAMLVLAAPSLPAAAAPGSGDARLPVPVLSWKDCGSAMGESFQCARARVPLDYKHPRGRSISISLIRHLAGNPAQRVGSLLLNPGGPGGSGVAFLRNTLPLIPAELQARFDLVSFDPRGIGESTPVRCFASVAEQQAFFNTLPLPFPNGAAEEATLIRGSRDFAERCAERNADLLPHMATADVARDMDLMRAALGESSLTYLGVSYGTFLGATYANLFPNRVRAVVLDGSVDPIEWTTGHDDEADRVPTFIRLGSHVGAAQTLGEFLRLCAEAGPARCPFAVGTDRQATADRFAGLMNRLRATPVLVPTPAGPVPLTYAEVVSLLLRTLYYQDAWPFAAAALQQLDLGDGQLMYQLSLALVPPSTTYDNQAESQKAVVCADSDNPGRARAWPPAARAADKEAPYFGSPWTYSTLPCADWPSSSHKDRYVGPFDRVTANPVLVVGTRFDPATPYIGARALADELGNARLLTLDGWGHTALFQPSSCAHDAMVNYLVNLTLPAEGTVCKPDVGPFDVAPPTIAGGAPKITPPGLPRWPGWGAPDGERRVNSVL